MSSVPPVHTGQCQVSHLSTLYNTKCPTGHTGQCQVSHLSTLYNTKCPTGHTGQCQVSHLSTLYNTKCPTGHTGQCQAFYLTTLNKGLVSHLSTQDNIVHFLGGCPICQNQAMSSVPPGHILQRQVSTLNEVKAPSCARSHSQSLAAAASDHVQWPSVTSQQLELLTTVGRFPPDNYQSSWRINSFTLTINTPSPPNKKKKKKLTVLPGQITIPARELVTLPWQLTAVPWQRHSPPPPPHPPPRQSAMFPWQLLQRFTTERRHELGVSNCCEHPWNKEQSHLKCELPLFLLLEFSHWCAKAWIRRHLLHSQPACPGANKGQSCNAATWHRLADAPWFAHAATPVGRRTLVYLRCSTGWQMHLG